MNKTITAVLLTVCLIEAAALAVTLPKAQRIRTISNAPQSTHMTFIKLGANEHIYVESDTPGFQVIVWNDRSGAPHSSTVMRWAKGRSDTFYCSLDSNKHRMQGGRLSFQDGLTTGTRDWDEEGIPTRKFTTAANGLGQRYTRKTVEWTELPSSPIESRKQ